MPVPVGSDQEVKGLLNTHTPIMIKASSAKDESSEPAEPDTKLPRLDSDMSGTGMAVDKFEEELKTANIEATKVIKDNVNPDTDTILTWTKSQGSGLNSADADPWATPAVDWDPVAKSPRLYSS
ncbi:hypothetical protein C0995_016309 [Termitomyces sp. Mi166|nr:hypothetical protein C0995_016309 [Termitomyces sp. Mi166\